MNEYLDLFGTFAKVGVMTFGGGYAMLPILQREVVEHKGWATEEELMDYFAIGQCTPGVIAVNTATFIGQKHRGWLGGIVATLGVVFPSLVIISILAGLITNFSHLAWVQNAFYGLRPASSGLIGAACAGVVLQVLLRVTSTAVPDSLFMRFSWDGTVSWMGLALAAVLLVLTNWVKLTKKWHPIVFIGLSAAVGVVFRFGGV